MRVNKMPGKQIAALPYRVGRSGPEILLSTTRRKGKWSSPKGWPMKGHKLSSAAAIEAFEEAGVVGRIGRRKVGHFQHRKRKGRLECAVEIFPLAVRRNLADWPEKRERKRRWFSGKAGCARVAAKGLQRAISEIIEAYS
jgi:8-oxo-dGTP pyrophosphatase MutT (NUDIX family)